VALEKDASHEISFPGLAVALVEVNAYIDVPGCSVPRLLSRSGLDSSALEEATANVTGTPELPVNVTGAPARTMALLAGLSDPSSMVMFAWTAPKQITSGGVGTYPWAELREHTAMHPNAPSATRPPTLDRLILTSESLMPN
jgi:hypothetical protein